MQALITVSPVEVSARQLPFQNRPCRRFYLLCERLRFHHMGVAAPTQDPSLHLFQAPEFQTQLNPVIAVLAKGADFMGRMPLAFPDQLRREGIEPDTNAVFARTRENPKSPAEVAGDGEIRRSLEFECRGLGLPHSGERKGAKLFSGEVEAEEIPLVLHAPEMVGLHPSPFVAHAAELFVFKDHFIGAQHRLAQGLEQIHIANGLANAPE